MLQCFPLPRCFPSAWHSAPQRMRTAVYSSDGSQPWKMALIEVPCHQTHMPLQAGPLSLNRGAISQALSPLLTQQRLGCTRESRWCTQVSMYRQQQALSRWFRTIPTGKKKNKTFGIKLFGNNNSRAHKPITFNGLPSLCGQTPSTHFGGTLDHFTVDPLKSAKQ